MADEVLADARVEGPADLQLVDAVHTALETLWRAVPAVSEEDRMLFTLAVSEVTTNVVAHAAGRDHPEISVRLEVDRTALTAVLTDNADPALIRLADVSMPGEDAESGRGLALALATLDELVHEPDGGNTWRLRRLRREATAPR